MTFGPESGSKDGSKWRRRAKASAPGAAFRWRPLSTSNSSEDESEALAVAIEAASELARAPDAELEISPQAPEAEGEFSHTIPLRPATDAQAKAPSRAFPLLRPRRVRLDPALAVRTLVVGDWLILAAAFLAAARLGFDAPAHELTLAVAAATALPLAVLKLGLWLLGAYSQSAARHGERAMGGLALGAIFGLGAAAFAGPDARAGAAIAAALPCAAIAMAALHGLVAFILSRQGKRAALEMVVLVGATEAARRLIQRARESGRMHIAAVVDDRAARTPTRFEGVPVAGGVDDLIAWTQLPEIDRIIVSVGSHADQRVKQLVERLRVLPNRVDLLVDLDKLGHVDRRFDSAASIACISGAFTRPLHAFAKRAFDIVVAAILALVFLPVMALIALVIAADSGGPILFRQLRHGFNNRVIEVWKFRTMKHAKIEHALTQVTANDPRVTRVGRFLRRTSLDELPQLFNVLKGDMSLVGPRPHAVGMRAADSELTRIAHDYAHRHRMRPGLTGWAQINGSRGPLETAEDVRARVRLDLQYIAHASLWLDVWILLRTIPALFGDRKRVR
ncbi:MAG: exopolysaccharide biosynthesis polyprenyl glycosylphosphotransferase [Hyphomonadaceae bacterium]